MTLADVQCLAARDCQVRMSYLLVDQPKGGPPDSAVPVKELTVMRKSFVSALA